jgi:gamma-carbonic anhydrase
MGLIIPVRGILPDLGKDNWVSPNATIVGEVKSGKNCTFWFNSVVRGDVHSIILGDRVNVQDGAIIHCTYQKSPTIIGDDVSIAHNAIVHGCTLSNRILVGMGAIVMDNTVVEDEVIIAAGAVVLANSRLESGFIYAGAPAKKLKEISPEQSEIFLRTSQNYILYASWYHN